MAKYISLLRGINIGGNTKVPMAELKAACQKAGFQNVKTYIQSGNVIFESCETETSVLENNFQELISQTFGFEVQVIVRTAHEMEKSIARNPFPKKKDAKIEKLHLTFLKEIPLQESLEKIQTFQFLPDRFEIVGKDVFVNCPNGYGRSKITNDFFEKRLKVTATTRNWKTVMKLYEMSNSI